MASVSIKELGEVYRLGGGATVVNSYVAIAFADGDDARRFCQLLRELAVPDKSREEVGSASSVGYFCNDTGGGTRNIRKADGLS